LYRLGDESKGENWLLSEDCELPVFGELGDYLPMFDESRQFVPGTSESTNDVSIFLRELEGDQRDAKEAPLNALQFARLRCEPGTNRNGHSSEEETK
jgi:hypothetical protein